MRRRIILIMAMLALLAAALAVKLVCYPTVKDAYFAMNQSSLQQAPGGLVIIRPTHFSLSIFRRGVVDTPAPGNRRTASRIMGRDVSLRDIIAVAWQVEPARVVMPPGAPTNNFDFIVTVNEPLKRLRNVIRSKFGYTADKENHETDVLALKVENPALPGVTVSAAGEKEDANVKNGRLYLTHMQFKELSRGFEQVLKAPVVDKTGLTNYYDFSLAWNTQFMRQLNNESNARFAVDKVLDDWGLGLEPDTAPMEMLVVKTVP
ncbi:MAG TPA: TIGR03435 family protein [Verrucomicrobiae bacterium]|nr:TIGR03435 family protein [Verrucomicrobiae bacterium]